MKQQFLSSFLLIRCYGKVFTAPLISNARVENITSSIVAPVSVAVLPSNDRVYSFH
jgi:hypothetical protein